jgi:hypothetical protein
MPWRRMGRPPFLTSALNGGEWSVTRSCRFTAGKEPPYLLHGRLDGPLSRSGHSGGEKYLSPLPRIEPQFLGRSGRSLQLHREAYSCSVIVTIVRPVTNKWGSVVLVHAHYIIPYSEEKDRNEAGFVVHRYMKIFKWRPRCNWQLSYFIFQNLCYVLFRRK